MDNTNDGNDCQRTW
ncbi:hypothetical protein U9715_16270 [Escherichia coli]|nr:MULTISPECIES: hypothetical protein [Enterobacteriaceae]MCE0524588.1 hypothetical protein [Escherichia coli]MCK2589404.1 hypothetical protein [Escherichia coli]MCV8874866.1 hypothetical protein [Escherichia coli]MDO2672707.1 hypothetical protein [Escherichia coli]MDY9836565.1 hypothetical protein [Escherichia coli]